MKTINKYLSGLTLLIIVVSTISCSKTFYTNANVNPNSPPSVPPGTMLTNIEVSLAFAQGGDNARFTSMFTQQTLGNTRQSQLYYSYVFAPTDPEFLWDNMYTSVMENDHALMDSAQTKGYNEYYGVTNILMAYALQVNVDEWGDIPYSQALLGAANIQPKYDVDQTLYGNIISLLNTGINSLRNSSPGIFKPGSDDVIYNGNVSSWIAFAYAIEARVYYHQCKLNTSFLTQALNATDSALANGFTIAQVAFGADATNNNPVYEFNEQRGDIAYSGTTLTDTLTAWNDPRAAIYEATGNISVPYGYYGGPVSPIEFFSLEEIYFIQAECMLRSSGGAPTSAVQQAYTTAITTNFTKLGLGDSAAAYLLRSQGTLPLTNAGALYFVEMQKWAALYMNPEAWSSFRLTFSKTVTTGVPALVPVSGNEVPRRMIYPLSEQTLNPNCPLTATLYEPQVFWDTYPN